MDIEGFVRKRIDDYYNNKKNVIDEKLLWN